MNTEESISIKFHLILPSEFSLDDFKEAIVEFAKEDEQTAAIFKPDTLEIVKEPGEHFDGATSQWIIPIVVELFGDVVRDLAKGAVIYMIMEKLLPYLQARFGLNVLKKRE